MGINGRDYARVRQVVLSADDQRTLGQAVAAARRARGDLVGAAPGPARLRLEAQVATGARAAETLVCSVGGLVWSLAHRHRGRGLAIEDLAQEGHIGVLHALDRWEPVGAAKFSTYARWWIRHMMVRAIDDAGATVRLPVHVAETVRVLRTAGADLCASLGREPTVAEVARFAGIDATRARGYLRVAQPTETLDGLLAGKHTLAEVVGDPRAASAVEAVEAAVDNQREVSLILARLDRREQTLMRLRYGLDGSPLTLSECARVVGLSRERARQILAGAVERSAADHTLADTG